MPTSSVQMPRPLRATVLILLIGLATTSLVFFTIHPKTNPSHRFNISHRSVGTFRSLLSFRTPNAFFTPTATISLTDDNSTFFAARPAAFGPTLATEGLSGQLWIGSGFGDDLHSIRGLTSAAEGELGCGDTPGWVDREWLSIGSGSHPSPPDSRSGPADNKEQPLSPDKTGTENAEALLQPLADATRLWSDYSDTRVLQHAAEISGKIVLLSRGGCGFSDKVKWAQRRGAIAVIVGDDIRGGPLVRMYPQGEEYNITIPSLFTSHTTAHLLSSLMPPNPQTWQGLAAKENAGRSFRPKRATPLQSSQLAGIKPQTWSSKIISGLGVSRLRSESEQDSASRIIRSKYTHLQEAKDQANSQPNGGHDRLESYEQHDGLWVTLTPTSMNASPFLNTLFVLVISPLITLAIVYVMLLLRSRIRRRRWRAPKSVVERLPVRIYHALPQSSTSLASLAAAGRPEQSDSAQTQTTPLLADNRSSEQSNRSAARPTGEASNTVAASTRYGSFEPALSEAEKADTGLAAWRRKYGGKQVECVVCLEEYVDGVSRVMSLPCGHEFHVDCM